jgi:hypothetical protein
VRVCLPLVYSTFSGGADTVIGAITFASESDYGPVHDEVVGR